MKVEGEVVGLLEEDETGVGVIEGSLGEAFRANEPHSRQNLAVHLHCRVARGAPHPSSVRVSSQSYH